MQRPMTAGILGMAPAGSQVPPVRSHASIRSAILAFARQALQCAILIHALLERCIRMCVLTCLPWCQHLDIYSQCTLQVLHLSHSQLGTELRIRFVITLESMDAIYSHTQINFPRYKSLMAGATEPITAGSFLETALCCPYKTSVHIANNKMRNLAGAAGRLVKQWRRWRATSCSRPPTRLTFESWRRRPLSPSSASCSLTTASSSSSLPHASPAQPRFGADTSLSSFLTISNVGGHLEIPLLRHCFAHLDSIHVYSNFRCVSLWTSASIKFVCVQHLT